MLFRSSNILNPKNVWQDKAEYDRLAKKLAHDFAENIKKYDLDASVVAAGPKA